jgi:hypothetical protein
MKQTTFASLAWNAKGRTTRRERFPAEMNAVVPWARRTALIEPHYPKGKGGGRPPMPLVLPVAGRRELESGKTRGKLVLEAF